MVNQPSSALISPGAGVIRGQPFNYPAGVMMRYAGTLEEAVRRMTRETEREIRRLFATKPFQAYFAQDASVSAQARFLTNSLIDKFDQFFADIATEAAQDLAESSDKASYTAVRSSLRDLIPGLSLDPSFLRAKLVREALSATVTSNVALIKSIPQQYLTQVQSAVMRSIVSGNGLADLVPFLQEQEGVTARRATDIAYDQTRKAYGSLNVIRCKNAGVKQFEWLHSGGGQHPRRWHEMKGKNGLNGNIYRIDDPPVIDPRTGEKGFPGQLIFCRCRMCPVITFDRE